MTPVINGLDQATTNRIIELTERICLEEGEKRLNTRSIPIGELAVMVGSAIINDDKFDRRNVRITHGGNVDGRAFVKIIRTIAVEANNMISYLDDNLRRCVIHLEFYTGDKNIGNFVDLRIAQEKNGHLKVLRKKKNQQDLPSASDEIEFDPDSICSVAAYIGRTLEEKGVIFTREEFSDFAMALEIEFFSGKGKK